MRRRRPGRGDDRRAAELARSPRSQIAEIEVRVQPRAARNEVVGERGGRLLVRVTAPPAENRANDALRKLIAKHVGVARSRVSVVRGTRSRDKVVRVEGVDEAELRRALAG